MAVETKQEANASERDEPVSGAVPRNVEARGPTDDKRAQIYTINAREGFNTAEIVNAAFAKRSIGAATPRRLEVIAPDGPSTSGGKRARQTIRLVAISGNAAPLMCGSLDVAQRQVELRSYASVRAQYEERFGQALDVNAEEYAKMCRDLEATLTAFRYTFVVEAPDATGTRATLTRDSAAEGVAPPARAPLLNLVLLGLVVAIIAGIAAAMTMR